MANFSGGNGGGGSRSADSNNSSPICLLLLLSMTLSLTSSVCWFVFLNRGNDECNKKQPSDCDTLEYRNGEGNEHSAASRFVTLCNRCRAVCRSSGRFERSTVAPPHRSLPNYNNNQIKSNLIKSRTQSKSNNLNPNSKQQQQHPNKILKKWNRIWL